MLLHEQQQKNQNLSTLDPLFEIFDGFAKSQAIFVAAKLGIADILNNGAKSGNELAQATGVNQLFLEHLMRMLVSVDLFSVDEYNNFTLNLLGKRLMTGTSDSLRSTILATTQIFYPLWGNLLHTATTGESAVQQTFQTSLYGYVAQNPELANHFNEFMEETTREWLLPLLEAYDFSKVETIVDVGGSTGSLIAVILKANTKLQGILFDQEDVVAGAGKVLSTAGVADRCQIIGGNFFDSIPKGGNLYLISRVLLNWDDSQALKILTNCYQAMTPNDQLLIVDTVMSTDNASPFLSFSTINLFLTGASLMRTEDEFRNLLSTAGFQVTEMSQTKSFFSLIEAKIKP
ncbi:methyltransferase [Nostoc sp. UIC 10630]|uniref:methyltransferase n=1 Tax=Nostoc sp. UIC 10630 TaxID=2100146 RepID=UPI0013D2005F|nr:methyltransferase [Nostoc sp. UIC 10630]NEU79517.1 methyltransferase [Nostoc sp. UIC 10630]QID92162.1 O-methyltransferase [Nostoc sp. UIC 10630]